jgi:citrate synthase
MPKNSLTVTDNRTGTEYEIPVDNGTYPGYGAHVPGPMVKGIKVDEDDFGLLVYDPAFMATASCKSAITFIDGEKGILRYRGYPIDQLAENASYLDTAYLLINGELPNDGERDVWESDILAHSRLHENVRKSMERFWHDAHPMGMFAATLAALSTFYPDAKDIADPDNRYLQIVRLIAKVPIVAGFTYRHAMGLPFVYSEESRSYSANFLNMLFGCPTKDLQIDPVIEKALDVLFILHADHEQNCSTTTMRAVGSSGADPYVSLGAAASALYGPLHGGANEQVLLMLEQIGDAKNVPAHIEKCKEGQVRLMGFGHRVYKNYDPRARIIKQMFDQVFEVTGSNPMLDTALELERIALEDDYFVSRKLYPNVDFYSGLIYEAIGLPKEIFTVLFAIGRTSGWLAQWQEMVTDKDQKITRPRQIYTGEDIRDYPS